MQGIHDRAREIPRAGRSSLTLAASLGCIAVNAALAALPPVPVPPENPITEAKRVLGKMLFFEEQLSSDNTVSCATCHVMPRAGIDPRRARHPGADGLNNTQDDVFASPGVIHSESNDDYSRSALFGVFPQVTPRSAPSPINAAYSPVLFWDGRATSAFTDPQTGQVVIASGGALESQTVGPPTSDVEMAHVARDWTDIVNKLRRVQPLALATSLPPDLNTARTNHPSYPLLFEQAFGDPDITSQRIAFAIATYERTLISDQAPFDRFIAGDNTALTPQQAQGFQAFQNSNCSLCHIVTNNLFTGNGFRNIGLRPPAEDRGLQNTSGNPADRGKFKVPSLRNVGLKNTFMHNGEFTTIGAVIGFYARAPGSPQQFPDNQDPLMAQVNVPPQAAQVIGDFLANALTDPRVANQLFPFDKPTLFGERPADRPANVAPGTPGSGGFVPAMIANTPPMVGNLEFKLGLDAALPNTTATLLVSPNPPVNGRVQNPQTLAVVTTQGSAAGQGIATFHWPLLPGAAQPGTTLFVQWRIDDPAAAAGQAFSNVVRFTMFCGSGGCPPPCSADYNQDGIADSLDIIDLANDIASGTPSFDGASTDFNHDGASDLGDVLDLANVIAGGACP